MRAFVVLGENEIGSEAATAPVRRAGMSAVIMISRTTQSLSELCSDFVENSPSGSGEAEE